MLRRISSVLPGPPPGSRAVPPAAVPARARSWLAATGWRLGAGLAALPAHVISIFLVYHGAGEAVGDLYRWLFPPRLPRRPARTGATLAGALLLGLPVAVAMSAAALVAVITIGHVIVDPVRLVWARPPGVVLLVAADLVLRAGVRVIRALVYGRAPEPGPPDGGVPQAGTTRWYPVRPPGRRPRPSGRAARPGTRRRR